MQNTNHCTAIQKNSWVQNCFAIGKSFQGRGWIWECTHLDFLTFISFKLQKLSLSFFNTILWKVAITLTLLSKMQFFNLTNLTKKSTFLFRIHNWAMSCKQRCETNVVFVAAEKKLREFGAIFNPLSPLGKSGKDSRASSNGVKCKLGGLWGLWGTLATLQKRIILSFQSKHVLPFWPIFNHFRQFWPFLKCKPGGLFWPLTNMNTRVLENSFPKI